MAEPVTAEYLAEDLGVDPGDVRVVVESLADLHDDLIPPALCAEVRFIFDPHGERKVPEYYGFTGEDV